MGYLLLFLLQGYLKWLDLVEQFESYMPVLKHGNSCNPILHKVVCQHVQGVVGSLITALLQIFLEHLTVKTILKIV